MNSDLPEIQRRTVFGLGLGAVATAAALPASALADPARRSQTKGPSATAGWVKAGDQTIRYEISGASGPVVVLLHEIGMGIQSWDLVMPGLPAGHRYLRYDLRGFGLSQKIETQPTFDDLVADLAGLLDALQVTGAVTLVGSAIGGAIALAFAAAHPERVSGIVALAPAAGPRGRGAAMLAQADAVEHAKMSAMAPRMAEKTFAGVDPNDPGRHLFESLQTCNDPRSAAALVRTIATTEFEPIVARVKAPVLFVAAGRDSDSQETADRLAKGLPLARVTALPSGHFMPVEVPAKVAELVVSFLRRQH